MCPEWVKTEKDESVLVFMQLNPPEGIDFEQRSNGYRLGFPKPREISTLIHRLLPHVEPVWMSRPEKLCYLPSLSLLFEYEIHDYDRLPELHFSPQEIVGVSFTHDVHGRQRHYVDFRLASPKVAQETFLKLLPVSTRLTGITGKYYLSRVLTALGMDEPEYINALRESILPKDDVLPMSYEAYPEKMYYKDLKEEFDLMLKKTSSKSI